MSLCDYSLIWSANDDLSWARRPVAGVPRKAAVVALLCIPLAAAGCSSSSSSSAASGGASSTSAAGSPSASASSSATGSGPVNVLYAGSLVDLMQKQVGPAFQTATGYSVTGFSAGSKDLAAEIKGKVHQGDVFISASPKVNATLEGAANGDWVSWYGTFATSALVIGYNPKSKFANDLKTMPWYKVITEPGLKLGFTDPATDPKGVLAVQAMTDTAKSKNLPALTALSDQQVRHLPRGDPGRAAAVRSARRRVLLHRRGRPRPASRPCRSPARPSRPPTRSPC